MSAPSASSRRAVMPSIRRAWRNSFARLARVTVQHIAGYERQRRQATLVAVSLDLAAS